MSTIELIAIEPCFPHRVGDKFSETERTATLLLQKGLVKLAMPSQNKVAGPSANKQNPTLAAGVARQSSASPAAPVSQQQTAKPSALGKRAYTRRAK